MKSIRSSLALLFFALVALVIALKSDSAKAGDAFEVKSIADFYGREFVGYDLRTSKPTGAVLTIDRSGSWVLAGKVGKAGHSGKSVSLQVSDAGSFLVLKNRKGEVVAGATYGSVDQREGGFKAKVERDFGPGQKIFIQFMSDSTTLDAQVFLAK